MKNTRYFALVCAGILAFAGCQKPELEGTANEPQGTTIIKATLSQEGIESKTQMIAGADADTYKVEWQAGDKVQINGNKSTGITILSDASNATFEFAGPVFDAPYLGVYPASAATLFAESTYTLELPKVQTYAGSDKFAPESALMLGYSAEAGNVAFKHAMAYIRLTLTAGEHPVKSVTFESNNLEALAGTYTATCLEGDWTLSPATGSAYAVTLDCGTDGAAIGDKMVVAIPAGQYAEGLKIVIKNTNNHYQIKKSTKLFEAEAGGIYDMSFEFVPQGTVVEGDIYTVSDWTEFAKAVAAGNDFEGKTITLQSDLTVDTYFEYAKGAFNGTFDGNGKTMTANGNIWPLFEVVGTNGVVKNLTMNGKFTRFANAGVCGNATIAKINKGLIQKVTNNSNTDLTVADGVVFGSICGQNGGTLDECKNYGNINISYSSTTNLAFYGGGLAALGHTVSGSATATAINTDDTCTPGTFINCENHGNIVATVESAKPIRQSYGGICGLVYFNGVKFENCINKGNIRRVSAGEASNNFSASVGGILGRSAAWYTTGTGDGGALDTSINGYDTEIKNCTNSGELFCKCRHSGGITATGSGARTDGVGGIVGTLIGNASNTQKVTGCTNTGKLTGGWNADVNTLALGGIVGQAAYTEISNCTAKCEITTISNEYYIGAAAGIAAFVHANVNVTGCIAKADMNIYAYPKKPFFYGLILGNIKTSATVSNASVAGSIIADGTDLNITAENYSDYLISATSNVKLSDPTTSWYTE